MQAYLEPRRFGAWSIGLLVLCFTTDVLAQGARRDEPPGAPQAQPKPKLTKAPTLVSAVPPEYPEQAASAGLEAVVKVRIQIDALGTVTQADVVKPIGNGFDEAAIAAILQYTFEPAEWDGKPGSIVVETAINFVINVEAEPEVPPEAEPESPTEGPPSHGGDMNQKISVSGEALERGSRSRLAGVIVSITELGMDAITDENGEFFFHGVPAGKYNVVAVDNRFDRFQRELNLKKNEQISLRLWLRPKGGNPYETTVEGDREVLEVTRRRLERRQLTTVPGTFGDPIRVIQALPGLSRTPFGTGFLVIRGSNPDDSGIFIDGHRVPLIFHFLGGPSILNPEFLESVTLYPGGFPTRFGRSHGGIVTVETRPSKSDGVHGSLDIDFLDSGAYVRAPITDKLSVAVSGRRSYLDLGLRFFLPEAEPGQTLLVVPVYWDGQARIDYDLGSEGRASLFYLQSSDELDVLSEDDEAEQTFNLTSSVKFRRLIANYTRPIGSDFQLSISPVYGRDSVAFGGSQTDSAAAFTRVDVTRDLLGYRMRLKGKLAPKLLVDSGIDMESQVTRYDLLVPITDDVRVFEAVDVPPELLRRNVDMFAYGAHADLAIDYIPRLRLLPGLRLEGFLLNGKTRFSVDPRLVARLSLADNLVAKGYAGLFTQPPQPEALDSRFGDPSIGLERAGHFGLGAEWSPFRNWSLDGEVYYIKRMDLVRFSQPGSGNMNPQQAQSSNLANSGDGQTYGLEMLVRREVTDNVYGWVSYTLSFTEDRRTPDDNYDATAFDQRHTLNAVASYKLGNWELGGRYRLATGRPQTPVVGGTFDADSGDYRRVTGPFRSERNATFQQFDIRLEYRWLFNRWFLASYLDVQNVFNAENIEGTQYDYRFRESSPITSLPFLPTLGIRGQF